MITVALANSLSYHYFILKVKRSPTTIPNHALSRISWFIHFWLLFYLGLLLFSFGREGVVCAFCIYWRSRNHSVFFNEKQKTVRIFIKSSPKYKELTIWNVRGSHYSIYIKIYYLQNEIFRQRGVKWHPWE